jgi:hypothetical protein
MKKAVRRWWVRKLSSYMERGVGSYIGGGKWEEVRAWVVGGIQFRPLCSCPFLSLPYEVQEEEAEEVSHRLTGRELREGLICVRRERANVEGGSCLASSWVLNVGGGRQVERAAHMTREEKGREMLLHSTARHGPRSCCC